IIYNMAWRAHDGAGTAARSRRMTHRRKAAADNSIKSTQIGHKLCMNRRNRGVLRDCIAFNA
ncbi:hypothetical protein, partial [Mesorhizobium sp. M4B.F.Ca.ET.190.01.1.1]|uniref:hypothetical protein n=1 Tax=Mesorhizobium sp. M4B.F.Ca.ET.190.01.1.1 TaxID=2563951 RepID=UPI001AEEFAD7